MSGLQSFPVRKDQRGLAGGDWSPIVPVVSKQVKVARSLARYGKQYGQIATAAETMEQEVLTGAKPPQEAANEAKAAIQPLLPQG
jgi:ABC-type glycerol-3-phosphate transport system substrate-binding protein